MRLASKECVAEFASGFSDACQAVSEPRAMKAKKLILCHNMRSDSVYLDMSRKLVFWSTYSRNEGCLVGSDKIILGSRGLTAPL